MYYTPYQQQFGAPMDFEGSMLQQEFNKLSVNPSHLKQSSPSHQSPQGFTATGGAPPLSPLAGVKHIHLLILLNDLGPSCVADTFGLLVRD